MGGLWKGWLPAAALAMVLPLSLPLWAAGQSEGGVAGQSEERARFFDLPGQPLAQALIEFGVQAKVTLLVDPPLLAGLRSSPVVGPLPPAEALRSLLASSGLRYHFDAALNAYVILPAAPMPVSPAPQPAPAPAVDPYQVEEVLVRARSYPLRYNTITHSQILGDVAYFDSSRFINVLPEKLLVDVQPQDVAQVLKYASGVTPGDGLGGTNDDLYVRGFQRHAVYVDGFRQSDNSGFKAQPFALEQIEILKGPSTLLYGQGDPGGMVNFVRKKPQAEEFVRLRGSLGTMGSGFAGLDANTSAEQWRGRLVMSQQLQDESGEVMDIDRLLLAPSLSWQLQGDTDLNLAYEYQRSSQQLRSQLFIYPYEGDADGIYINELAQSAQPDFTASSHFISASLNHQLDDNWRLNAEYFWRDEERQGVRATLDNLLKSELLYNPDDFWQSFELYVPGSRIAVPLLWFMGGDGREYGVGEIRSLYQEYGDEALYNAKLRLDGTLDIGSTVHHLSMGAEWYRQDLFKRYWIESRNLFAGERWAPEDLLDLVFEVAERASEPGQPLGELEYQAVRTLYSDYGLFIQDVVELNERWSLTLGGRYSYLQGEHYAREGWVTLPDYGQFSGQLGLVYKWSDNTSLYANYSQAVRANYHLDDVGTDRVDPESSDQLELGIKHLGLDGRMLTSIGLYQIDKDNLVDIQFIGGFRTSVQGVSQRARGVDMDVSLALDERWDLIGSLAWVDAERTSGDFAGKAPRLVAGETLSLYARRQLQGDLAWSGGVKWVGERYADLANSYSIDSFFTLDTALSGEFTWQAQEVRWHLSVNNLLDERYDATVVEGVAINEAEGRRFMGSLEMAW